MKSTLDNFGPIALAGYVGYWQYKKDSKNMQMLLMWVLGAYLIGLYIIPKVSKAVEGAINKPESIGGTVPGGAGTIGGGSSTVPVSPIDARIRNITDTLFQDIEEVMGTRNSAIYAEVVALTNGDLAAIYNDWQERYYSKNSETLIRAMESETYWFSTSTNATTIINRLKALI